MQLCSNHPCIQCALHKAILESQLLHGTGTRRFTESHRVCQAEVFPNRRNGSIIECSIEPFPSSTEPWRSLLNVQSSFSRMSCQREFLSKQCFHRCLTGPFPRECTVPAVIPRCPAGQESHCQTQTPLKLAMGGL